MATTRISSEFIKRSKEKEKFPRYSFVQQSRPLVFITEIEQEVALIVQLPTRIKEPRLVKRPRSRHLPQMTLFMPQVLIRVPPCVTTARAIQLARSPFPQFRPARFYTLTRSVPSLPRRSIYKKKKT